MLREHTATLPENFHPPAPQAQILSEAGAAAYLGLVPGTLRVWRSKSRRAKRLIGPRWVEIGGDGRRKCIRYRKEDLDAYAAAGAVPLAPRKVRGRPRKGEC
jgi:hypothetical protein